MSDVSIFRLLRFKAKSWWYFKDLRSRGQDQEAREKEHRSLRSNIKSLREAIKNGGYLSIGRGGWTLHIDDGHTLHHYGGIEQPFPLACKLLNIPIIDSTSIPDDLISQVISFPCIAIRRDDEGRPLDPFSYARLKDIAGRYKKLGATIYNLGG
jgi:hypothetical protein